MQLWSSRPGINRESYVCELSNLDFELREEALAMLRHAEEGGALLDLSMLGRQWVRPAALSRTLRASARSLSRDDTALCGLSGRAVWAKFMRLRIWISERGWL